MADVLTPAQRHFNMSQIKGRNTTPEMLVRRGLHARGFRYTLHSHKLPGKPDIVLPRFQVVILVHGCFWHGHDCPMFHLPKTRTEFWKNKIAVNRARDNKTHEDLLARGWRIISIWECSLKGNKKIPLSLILDSCENFIKSKETNLSICGI